MQSSRKVTSALFNQISALVSGGTLKAGTICTKHRQFLLFSTTQAVFDPPTRPQPRNQILEEVALPDLKYDGSQPEFKGLETDFPCLLKQ